MGFFVFVVLRKGEVLEESFGDEFFLRESFSSTFQTRVSSDSVAFVKFSLLSLVHACFHCVAQNLAKNVDCFCLPNAMEPGHGLNFDLMIW